VGVTASAIRSRAGYIGAVAMLFAIGAGVLVAGTITRPVRSLVAAARGLGGGDFARRVAPHGTGELDELGEAFNRMAEALGREASLVQAGQIRAVGELGAGLAHALNNPLAGVLGALQLVRGRAPTPDPLLVAAETEAQRCREILADMLRTTTPPAPGLSRAEDLGALVDEAVRLATVALAARRVRLEWVLPTTPVAVRVDGPRVVHALVQLLAAAGGLAGPEGVLRVEVSGEADGGAVRIGILSPEVSEDRMRAGGLAAWGARAALADAGALFVPGGSPTTWDVRFEAGVP
jgi:signal transduction histidine kinase